MNKQQAAAVARKFIETKMGESRLGSKIYAVEVDGLQMRTYTTSAEGLEAAHGFAEVLRDDLIALILAAGKKKGKGK